MLRKERKLNYIKYSIKAKRQRNCGRQKTRARNRKQQKYIVDMDPIEPIIASPINGLSTKLKRERWNESINKTHKLSIIQTF